ncbi:Uncharacterised protein [Mycobacteroides abscessus subsp. abscessus]|nr:Uncharacterised protein [Mycobacteroides abscessus subsp. abscessus]
MPSPISASVARKPWVAFSDLVAFALSSSRSLSKLGGASVSRGLSSGLGGVVVSSGVVLSRLGGAASSHGGAAPSGGVWSSSGAAAPSGGIISMVSRV